MTYIDAMKAEDLKPLINWGAPEPFTGLAPYLTPANVMQRKLDGVRTEIEFGAERNRVTSGSTANMDRTDNFAHFRDAVIPTVAGVILDGELMAAGTAEDGLLTSTTGLINSNPPKAAETQRVTGPARFFAFDVLQVPDFANPGQVIDLTGTPYRERRRQLVMIITTWQQMYPQLPVFLVPQTAATAANIAQAIKDGYEGVIIKNLDGKYYPGKRGFGWYKVKTMSPADAKVTGWKPGKGSNAGRVGSLELSLFVGGAWTVIGHAGNMTVKDRLAVTGQDGALRADLYGKVVQFEGQGVGVNGKIRHCLLRPGWLRTDKDATPANCGADQLALFPRV